MHSLSTQHPALSTTLQPRLLLALCLLLGSEVLAWNNPTARPLLEWLLLLPGYLALSALLLDFISRYRVRDLFGALILTGIYSLSAALVLNPASTLNDLPRTLMTRVMGAHALLAAEVFGLFLLLTGGHTRSSRYLFGGALIVGLAWGVWVKNWPLDEGFGVVELPTLLAYGVAGLAALAVLLYILNSHPSPASQPNTGELSMKTNSPQGMKIGTGQTKNLNRRVTMKGITPTNESVGMNPHPNPATQPNTGEGTFRADAEARGSAGLFSREGEKNAVPTAGEADGKNGVPTAEGLRLSRRGWLLVAVILTALLGLRLLQGEIPSAALLVVGLLVLCWAILWFRGRKKGATLLDRRVPVQPLALSHFLLMGGLFLGAAVFAYNLPAFQLGNITPYSFIGLGFTAYGLAWLPTVSLVLGIQGYLRQLATRQQ